MPFRSSLELQVGDASEGCKQQGNAVEGQRELLGNGSFPRAELYALKALSSQEFKNFWWVLRGQHAGTGRSLANHLTVCKAGLLAPWGPPCRTSPYLPVIWGLRLGTSHLRLSLLILPPQLAGSSSLEGATDDYQVKTGAQGWQSWRVTADQGQTWHCGLIIILSYFLDAGWWHTGLSDRHGPYLPGSEGTYSYQFLLIALKISQPHPVANSHGLCARSASLSGPSPGRAIAPKLHRWGSWFSRGHGEVICRLILLFSWLTSNQASSLTTFPISFVARMQSVAYAWTLKDWAVFL